MGADWAESYGNLSKPSTLFGEESGLLTWDRLFFTVLFECNPNVMFKSPQGVSMQKTSIDWEYIWKSCGKT